MRGGKTVANDRPDIKEARSSESLDEVVKNGRTQFQRQVGLLNYANFRFNSLHPMTDFPRLDFRQTQKFHTKSTYGIPGKIASRPTVLSSAKSTLRVSVKNLIP